MLWFASYFPLVLNLTLFTITNWRFLLLFLQLVLFRSLPHPLGGGRDIFSLFHSLSTILLCFGSSLFSSFLYFIECVCRACRIQYDVPGTWHCAVYCAYGRRGNVVSLWRSFVTTEFIPLRSIEESARTPVVLDVDG